MNSSMAAALPCTVSCCSIDVITQEVSWELVFQLNKQEFHEELDRNFAKENHC